MSTFITVLGAGSWGSALAQVLAENGNHVMLWTNSENHANIIKSTRQNVNYLKDFKFHPTIQITHSLQEAISFAETILFVVPTSAIRPVSKKVSQLISTPKLLVHASKGLEKESYLRISQVIEEEIGPDKRKAVVVLSGPSHAEEVIQKDITSVTSASKNHMAAEEIQNLFINHYFRVYTNDDMVGVELGAALKNIIALGSGMLKGLNYGDNALAALITRGLAEITRLGVTMGADPLTFQGLSGVGDLIVTCTSPHSRNWQAGYLIGQGYSVDQAMKEVGMIVEGVFTTKAAFELSNREGVEMPLTAALFQILYENHAIQDVLEQLMSRVGKAEL